MLHHLWLGNLTNVVSTGVDGAGVLVKCDVIIGWSAGCDSLWQGREGLKIVKKASNGPYLPRDASGRYE